MSGDGLPTLPEMNARLTSIAAQLRASRDNLDAALRGHAEARYAYDVALSRADTTIRAKGEAKRESQIKALAQQECEPEYRALLLADHAVKIARATHNDAQGELSAWQTLAGMVRDEMRLAR